MITLGLDIGGARIKAALVDSQGRSLSSLSRPFPLWKFPERLAQTLSDVIASQAYDRVALTMTGELCDCFTSKAEGVDRILGSVVSVAGADRVHVWNTTGRFVLPDVARLDPWGTAAANWLALATFAADWTEGRPGLLLDLGSTTCDVIPLANGPRPIGRNDPDRLASGELVYFGVERTPLYGLVSCVTLSGRTYPLMAELFATTRDVFLWSGELPEEPTDCDTADGRPATREAARGRLSRMIGSDPTRFSPADATEFAHQIRESMLTRIGHSMGSLADKALGTKPERIVVSGQGEFLLPFAAQRYQPGAELVSLGQRLGPEVSKSACAHAVAVLLNRSLGA